MRALAIALCLLAATPEAKPRVYRPTTLKDLEDIVSVLRMHVALLRVEVALPPDDPLGDPEREGYAIVLDAHHLAALTFTVENAKRVVIHGPGEQTVEARVTIYDKKRRVAILETSKPIAQTGLEAAKIAPKPTRKEGDDVFALVYTGVETSAMHGVLIYVGDDPEYGGHHRVDLRLARGMPVFDNEARFVGYARAAAFDPDQLMLVTPEMIAEARSATTSRARDKAKKTGARPWWAK